MATIVFGSPEAKAILEKERPLHRAEEYATERDRLIAEGRLWRVRTCETVNYFKTYEVEANSATEAARKYDGSDDVDDWEETEDYEDVCHNGVELITPENKDKRR